MSSMTCAPMRLRWSSVSPFTAWPMVQPDQQHGVIGGARAQGALQRGVQWAATLLTGASRGRCIAGFAGNNCVPGLPPRVLFRGKWCALMCSNPHAPSTARACADSCATARSCRTLAMALPYAAVSVGCVGCATRQRVLVDRLRGGVARIAIRSPSCPHCAHGRREIGVAWSRGRPRGGSRLAGGGQAVFHGHAEGTSRAGGASVANPGPFLALARMRMVLLICGKVGDLVEIVSTVYVTAVA